MLLRTGGIVSWKWERNKSKKKDINILISMVLLNLFKCFILSSVCCFLAPCLSTLYLTVSCRITMSFTTSHNEHSQARMQTQACGCTVSGYLHVFSKNRSNCSGTFGMSKKACLWCNVALLFQNLIRGKIYGLKATPMTLLCQSSLKKDIFKPLNLS